MAPAPQRVAVQPVVADAPAPTSAGMHYPSGSMIGPSSFLPAAFSPSGALPMYSTQFQSPAFVPGGF